MVFELRLEYYKLCRDWVSCVRKFWILAHSYNVNIHLLFIKFAGTQNGRQKMASQHTSSPTSGEKRNVIKLVFGHLVIDIPARIGDHLEWRSDLPCSLDASGAEAREALASKGPPPEGERPGVTLFYWMSIVRIFP